MRRKSKKSRRRGLRRRALRVGLWAAGLIAAFYLSCTVSLVLLRTLNPLVTGVQLQRRIEAALSPDTTYEKRQTFVHLDEIPLHVQRAVIAAEDGSFYQHGGVDWAEILIVLGEYRKSGRMRGASTISQQLVKNLFLGREKTLSRKFQEHFITWEMEKVFELHNVDLPPIPNINVRRGGKSSSKIREYSLVESDSKRYIEFKYRKDIQLWDELNKENTK